MGNFTRSIKCFEQVLVIEPTNIEAAVNLGLALHLRSKRTNVNKLDDNSQINSPIQDEQRSKDILKLVREYITDFNLEDYKKKFNEEYEDVF